MVICLHEYGTKKRPNGEHYCPVCRAYILPEDFKHDDDEDIGQGRSDADKSYGGRFGSDSGSEGFKWRKL